MTQFGYKISAEEHRPNDLVRQAQRAEEVGFTFAAISDHFHPWTDRQGESPLVWAVLGGIAQATERLEVFTAVTCPTIRIHPAIIAQAAATVEAMMPGRFALGVGTGENLNEHILGDRWPAYAVRAGMLEEAVEVIRLLWEGGQTSHYGEYYMVENARIYTLPDKAPPIYMAAGGPKSATLAGKIADGLITVGPKPKLIKAFREAGGEGKPVYGEIGVCWAKSEAEARRTALEVWPIAGFKGPLTQELAVPAHFEAAAKMLSEEDVAAEVVCGPDAERHVESLREFVEAGYTGVFIHQVGADQEGFFKFYEREVLPAMGRGG